MSVQPSTSSPSLATAASAMGSAEHVQPQPQPGSLAQKVAESVQLKYNKKADAGTATSLDALEAFKKRALCKAPNNAGFQAVLDEYTAETEDSDSSDPSMRILKHQMLDEATIKKNLFDLKTASGISLRNEDVVAVAKAFSKQSFGQYLDFQKFLDERLTSLKIEDAGTFKGLLPTYLIKLPKEQWIKIPVSPNRSRSSSGASLSGESDTKTTAADKQKSGEGTAASSAALTIANAAAAAAHKRSNSANAATSKAISTPNSPDTGSPTTTSPSMSIKPTKFNYASQSVPAALLASALKLGANGAQNLARGPHIVITPPTSQPSSPPLSPVPETKRLPPPLPPIPTSATKSSATESAASSSTASATSSATESTEASDKAATDGKPPLARKPSGTPRRTSLVPPPPPPAIPAALTTSRPRSKTAESVDSK